MLKPVLANSPIEAVRHGGIKPLYFIEIDLSTAGTLRKLPQPGNMIYFDQNTTGVADLYFSDPEGHPFPVGVNSAIRDFLYSELYLSWSAQSGKILRIWYGWDADVIPPNQTIATIGSVGTIDQLTPFEMPAIGTFFYVGTSTGINLFSTSGSNLNGITIHGAGVNIQTANTYGRIMSKATTIVAVTDTAATTIASACYGSSSNCGFPVRIPAGHGLYAGKTDAATGSGFWCQFTKH